MKKYNKCFQNSVIVALNHKEVKKYPQAKNNKN